MKKVPTISKFNLLFIVVFISSVLVAQESKYGVKAGLNLSSISSDDLPENAQDARIGFMFGFLAEYALQGNLSLQPEVHYSAQGNKEEDFRANYLNVPISLKYRFSDYVAAHIGPQLGLKIWEWENNEAYSNFDFSAVLGVEVNITDNLFADLRYAFGLTNVFEDPGSGIEITGNGRVIQLSIGYSL